MAKAEKQPSFIQTHYDSVVLFLKEDLKVVVVAHLHPGSGVRHSMELMS